MKQQLDPKRVLRIIEGLVIERSDEDPLLSLIYRIAHQARNPECADKHANWTEETLETEQRLVDANVLPPWGEEYKKDLLTPEFPWDIM